MKLIKCYVSSFGKLQDFTFDFNDGLNTIKHDNGWGKSTLATFIKTMFYGFSGGAKRSLDDNERKKFKPWNYTQAYGGYVVFEWGGKEYKLERYFGNKESDDTVNLIDEETGKRYSNTENLGKRIFEIDEEGFLSTTYYSQKDFDIKSNTSLTAKFNSVCEVEDSSAFDKALLKIEQKAKTYKYSGDRGLIADNKRELFAVNEEIERVNRLDETLKIVKREAEQLQEEVLELKNQTAMLAERVALAGKAEADALKSARYEELLSERDNLSALKLEIEKVFNGHAIDNEQLNDYAQLSEELSKIVSNAKIIEEEICEIERRNLEQKKQFPKKSVTCLLVVAVLFLIAGVSTIRFNFLLAIIGLALSGVCFVSSLVVLLLFKKNKKADVYEQILRERKQKLDNLRQAEESYKSKLNVFLGCFNISIGYDYRSAIDYLKTALVKKVEIMSRLDQIVESIKGFDGEIKRLDDAKKVPNIDVLRQELYNLQSAYAEKSKQLANKLATIKDYQEITEKLCDLEAKKFELLERAERYKAEYTLLTETAEFLKKADENLKIKYRAPLQNSLNKYLQMMAGESVRANIDIDLNVTIEERGGEKQTEYYSKGYRNLFEICKRFALTDVLFTGEKPFIILDDPFYNLDDDKLSSALELVKKLSKEYQIIYLVCHESRRA